MPSIFATAIIFLAHSVNQAFQVLVHMRYHRDQLKLYYELCVDIIGLIALKMHMVCSTMHCDELHCTTV